MIRSLYSGISGLRNHQVSMDVTSHNIANVNTTGYKSAMDYYIHVEGNNNVIEECYTERIGELGHGGHGIGLKGNCENNLIINCISKGMGSDGYQLRHRGVKNNIIKNSLGTTFISEQFNHICTHMNPHHTHYIH